MRTGTDATRAGKTRKKAAKVPGLKPGRKSAARPSSDAVQQTLSQDGADKLQPADAAVVSGDCFVF